MMQNVFSRRFEIFLEFLIFGLVVGIVEDVLAILFATDQELNWGVIGIAAGVALPFAILGEVIVDRKNIIPVKKTLEGLKKNGLGLNKKKGRRRRYR